MILGGRTGEAPNSLPVLTKTQMIQYEMTCDVNMSDGGGVVTEDIILLWRLPPDMRAAYSEGRLALAVIPLKTIGELFDEDNR